MSERKKLAILVGGGPAPGINGVISSVTIEAVNQGLEVIGVRDGFKHLVTGDTTQTRPLGIADVAPYYNRGGSLLGTSRTNPAKKPADLEKVIEAVQARQGRRDQLAIRVGERFVLVQADEVVFASLVDEAIVVVTNTVSGTSNYRTLDELQSRLDPAVFWRVHRSHLVNITKIKEIVPWFSRNYLLKMKDVKNTEIPVSRSQTRRLREYLQI